MKFSRHHVTQPRPSKQQNWPLTANILRLNFSKINRAILLIIRILKDEMIPYLNAQKLVLSNGLNLEKITFIFFFVMADFYRWPSRPAMRANEELRQYLETPSTGQLLIGLLPLSRAPAAPPSAQEKTTSKISSRKSIIL